MIAFGFPQKIPIPQRLGARLPLPIRDFVTFYHPDHRGHDDTNYGNHENGQENQGGQENQENQENNRSAPKYGFPLNLWTTPLIAVVFLLATTAIGSSEIKAGTVGANHISPLLIMGFFMTLAYIAQSLKRSGIFPVIAEWVLRRGGHDLPLLFGLFYLLISAITFGFGNDPVILTLTPVLVHMAKDMTKESQELGKAQSSSAQASDSVQKTNVTQDANQTPDAITTRNESSAKMTSGWLEKGMANRFEQKLRAEQIEENARPWIFMLLWTGNIASAALVSSNPTNLVVSEAFRIKYLIYLRNSIVPVVVVLVILYLVLRFAENDLAPANKKAKTVSPSNVTVDPSVESSSQVPVPTNTTRTDFIGDSTIEPQQTLRCDWWTAGFGTANFIVTIVVLTVLNFILDIPAVYVTAPTAFVQLVWDFVHDIISHSKARPERTQTLTKTTEQSEIKTTNEKEAKMVEPKEETETKNEAKADTSGFHTSVGTSTTTSDSQNRSFLSRVIAWPMRQFPITMTVLRSLPFGLFPFMLLEAILVQSLVSRGWTALFARAWDWWVGHTETIGAIAGMGLLSILLGNVCGTNIGSTMLLSCIIQDWQALQVTRNKDPIDERTLGATIYTLALGSNFTAFSLAFSASLAGLLWRSILADAGVHVTPRQFVRKNVVPVAVSTAVGCGILAALAYRTNWLYVKE